MTIEINGSQMLVAAGVALVGPTAAIVFSELVRARRRELEETARVEQHRQNIERLDKIEGALGIENPDEVAFMRASDGKRIEGQIAEILHQLGNGALGRFALREATEHRFRGIEHAAISDHGIIRKHGEDLVKVRGEVETLRRDVNGLMADG